MRAQRHLFAFLVVVALIALPCFGQGTKIQFQQAGSNVFFGNGYFKFNVTGSGCTASNVAGVFTLNCSGGGGGTVTSVSGTTNQIDVATGTTTPVVSLDAAITLPGTINKYTLTAPATGSTLTIADGKTFTANNTLTLSGTDAASLNISNAVIASAPGAGLCHFAGATQACASSAVVNADLSGLIGLSHGGLNLDLTATGGANQVIKQLSLGGAVTVAALVSGEIPNNGANTTGNAATATAATNMSGGTIGVIPYQSAASTSAFLAANTAATDQVLVSHGTGAAGLAPTLSNAPALSAANMTSFPTLNQNTSGSAGSVLFSGVGGATNANALVIGTGGSLTVSGSGTNNATTLGGATFAAPGTIGGTTPGVVFASNTITPYALDTGAANAIAITVTGLPTAIATGLCVNFKAANTATNTTTLNVTPSGQSAYGAISLQKRATTGVVALGIGSHDIVIGGMYTACYDGTEWVLGSTSGAVNTTAALIANQVVVGAAGNQVQSYTTLIASSNGQFSTYNGELTAAPGIPYLRGATSQKSETTTADANVLTVTPASVIGTYRACVVISVSAATSGVIAWTLSWTDSNGTAQSNIAQDLFQNGTAAPNTTFTTSVAGNYNGCTTFDVNSAAASIIVK